MGAFKCPNCSHCSFIFPAGPVRLFAEKQGISYLGSVDLNPALSDVFEISDGKFSLDEYTQSQKLGALRNIAQQVEGYFDALSNTGKAY